MQTWIIPSPEFAKNAVQRPGGYDLNLESEGPEGSKLKQSLSRYRNAWRLLTDGAIKPYGG